MVYCFSPHSHHNYDCCDICKAPHKIARIPTPVSRSYQQKKFKHIPCCSACDYHHFKHPFLAIEWHCLCYNYIFTSVPNDYCLLDISCSCSSWRHPQLWYFCVDNCKEIVQKLNCPPALCSWTQSVWRFLFVTTVQFLVHLHAMNVQQHPKFPLTHPHVPTPQTPHTHTWSLMPPVWETLHANPFALHCTINTKHQSTLTFAQAFVKTRGRVHTICWWFQHLRTSLMSISASLSVSPPLSLSLSVSKYTDTLGH